MVFDHNLTSEFTVAAIDDGITDIMLGSNWLETLGTFTLNAKKKLMTFFHEKKKVIIHDLSVRVLSSQNTNTKSPYGSYEDLNNLLTDKDEEIAQFQNKIECQES